MKAKNISGQAPGGKRTKLAEALPLDTPFVIQIFPIYACTFKCGYCIFQMDEKKRGFISDKVMMDLDLLKKSVDEMAAFSNKVKVLRFVGIGEPLLHKDIVEMIRYAVSKNVANKVEIITNASLLTPEMSDALISAGLSRLVVSLQGASKEKYKKICNTDIDFEKFVSNLKYFFDHRGKTHLYLKIVDSALDGKDDEERFYKTFGNICDSLAIEHIVPIHSGVDYEKLLRGKDMFQTQFGLPVGEMKICPQPFFTMQINPDGKVVPCYSFEYPEILGNVNEESVVEIWNGEKFRRFRRKMLDGFRGASKNCAECNISRFRLFPEDILDNDAEKLKKLYE